MTDTSTSSLPRELWRTRPHRLPDQGKLTGVCAGVAARYDVDPVLVRVAVVVATVFGGAGVPVYLAAWLLMPAASDDVSPGEGLLRRGRSTVSTTTAALFAVGLALSLSLLDVTDGVPVLGGGLLGVGLLLGGVVLLHQRRPVASVPAPPAVSLDKDAGLTDGLTPPAWDPLGTAPFAWHLPEPGPEPTVRRSRSRHTSTVLGFALLAVGAAVALRLTTGAGWLPASRIAALALFVVGVGLVVGAFRRRGWGLLAVAAPLAGFVLVSSFAPPFDRDGFGSRTITVTAERQLQDRYEGRFGSLELDLSRLELDGDRTVDVAGGAGGVTVLLPADLDVVLDCTDGRGTTECDIDEDVGGDGGVLTLQVDGGFGSVAVRRV